MSSDFDNHKQCKARKPTCCAMTRPHHAHPGRSDALAALDRIKWVIVDLREDDYLSFTISNTDGSRRDDCMTDHERELINRYDATLRDVDTVAAALRSTDDA